MIVSFGLTELDRASGRRQRPLEIVIECSFCEHTCTYTCPHRVNIYTRRSYPQICLPLFICIPLSLMTKGKPCIQLGPQRKETFRATQFKQVHTPCSSHHSPREKNGYIFTERKQELSLDSISSKANLPG